MKAIRDRQGVRAMSGLARKKINAVITLYKTSKLKKYLPKETT